MNFKNITTKLLTALLLLTALATLGLAQTALSTTTLTTAVDSKQTTWNISTTNMLSSGPANAINTAAYIDHELVWVSTVIDSTHVLVQRGKGQTRPHAHAAGATVYFGNPAGNFLSNFPDSAESWGACTASAQVSLPLIYAQAGDILDCLGGQWVRTSVGGPPVLGSAVASASTIAATGTAFHVTGTTAINTITVPYGWAPGKSLTIIPDALGSTGTSGNIALGTTFVVNKALILTWSGSKWIPSY